MRVGLYGKLPCKRDFVAHGVTRPFLKLWEPWLQASVAASRLSLGSSWPKAFRNAPFWRFWLGRSICGSEALGVVMPSVDGVGRYFPLTLVASAEPGEALVPPDADPRESWFAGAEDLLLSALAEGTGFETVTTALAVLPGPDIISDAASAGSAAPLAPGWPAILAQARRADPARHAAALGLFWTAGGQGFPATAIVRHGLPEPDLFTDLIVGTIAGDVAC